MEKNTIITHIVFPLVTAVLTIAGLYWQVIKDDKDEKKKKKFRTLLVTLFAIFLSGLIGSMIWYFTIPDPNDDDDKKITPTPIEVVVTLSPTLAPTPAPTPDSSPIPQPTATTLADRARIIEDPEASNTFLLDTYTSEQFLEIGKFHEEGTGGFDQDDEKALENYKTQLKLAIKVMLEYGDKLPNPGEYEEEE